jgi:hypothetical protein
VGIATNALGSDWSRLLTTPQACDYCQDMLGSLSADLDNILTEEEIDRQTNRRLELSLKGSQVVFWGINHPGEWVEPNAASPCKACDSGKAMHREKHAICLACSRATPTLDKLISSALREQEALTSQTRLLASVAITVRAKLQRLRRAGIAPRPGRGNHGARTGQALSESLRNRSK